MAEVPMGGDAWVLPGGEVFTILAVNRSQRSVIVSRVGLPTSWMAMEYLLQACKLFVRMPAAFEAARRASIARQLAAKGET